MPPACSATAACVWLYVLLLLHLATPQPAAQSALLSFKASVASCKQTALDKYDYLFSWNNTSPMSEWGGIDLSEDGTLVLRLGLDAQSLCGPLPSSFSALTALTELNLHINELSGTLPPEWSALRRVSSLSLYFNNMHGSIPAAWSELGRLESLLLYGNGLTGQVPAELSTLTRLSELELMDNLLSGPLAHSWSTLTRLTTLDLSNNSLSGSTPPEWSKLQSLMELDLSRNNLTGPLRPEWATLQQLTALNMENNSLTGPLPPEFGSLAAESLDLSLGDNALQGPIPAAWSQLQRMDRVSLNLSHNQLTGTLPQQWNVLKNLSSLLLGNNSLEGTLPSQFSTLSTLYQLDLSSNSFKGTLQVDWSRLEGLSSLSLANNTLEGTLPKEWSAMSVCFDLDLSYNAMQGLLPVEWSALVGLGRLNLANNSLHGGLPVQWSKLMSLSDLRLFNNSLTGTLPNEWRTLPLQVLNLAGNRISGTIPAGWVKNISFSIKLSVVEGNYGVLTVLDLSNNAISGSIPKSWLTSNITLVEEFSQEPMESLLWWDQFVYFDIASNNITGALPRLPAAVQYFNASGNSLTGSIPAWPSSLVYLHLSHNMLTGAVPDVTSNSSLTYINLDNNKLTSLPDTFQGPSASYVSIAHNQLQGTLPAGPSYNHSILYLDLGNNQLTGPFPESWSDQTWMYLALDGNRLSGSLGASWRGDISVLLMHKNALQGGLPPTWPHNATARVLSFSSTRLSSLPESWGSGHSFPKLSLLAVADNPLVGVVPVAWVNKTAFNQQVGDNGTVLQLGHDLWMQSSRNSNWRKTVCMDPELDARLKRYLQAFSLTPDVRVELQQMLDQALAGLTGTLRRLNITDVSFNIGPAALRLVEPTTVTRQQVCNNSSWVVVVQWSIVGAALFVMVVMYGMEVRWKVISRGCMGVRSRLQLCWGGAASPPEQPGGHAARFGGGVPFTTSQLKSCFLSAKFAASLVLYWYDVVSDLVVIVQVWQFWPGKVLLGIFVLQYVLALGLLMWRLHVAVHPGVLLLVAVFGLPLLPLLDTAMFVILALRLGDARLPLPAVKWEPLFEMRDVMEVCVEALPSVLLQTAVFLLGNQPNIGWYLNQKLFILSAVGSSAQILRLAAFTLWAAAKKGVSPWTVLWRKVSLYDADGEQLVMDSASQEPVVEDAAKKSSGETADVPQTWARDL